MHDTIRVTNLKEPSGHSGYVRSGQCISCPADKGSHPLPLLPALWLKKNLFFSLLNIKSLPIQNTRPDDFRTTSISQKKDDQKSKTVRPLR